MSLARESSVPPSAIRYTYLRFWPSMRAADRLAGPAYCARPEGAIKDYHIQNISLLMFATIDQNPFCSTVKILILTSLERPEKHAESDCAHCHRSKNKENDNNHRASRN